MPWDDDNQGEKGPWGQAPKGNTPQNNKPTPEQADDLDEFIRKSQEKILQLFSGRKKGSGGGSGKGKGGMPVSGGKIYGIIAAIVGVLWLASGVYTVNTKEVGVVLRFGKYAGTTQPGMNYHLPSPIENVVKIRVTDRYRTEISSNNVEGDSSSRLLRRRSRLSSDDKAGQDEEILMLTGDENIVDVSFEVQWQIENAEKFLFNVHDPEKTVRDAAESAMREIVGTTPLNDILSDGRTRVQLQTKELIQSMLDSYDCGIKVEEINMRGVPPTRTMQVNNVVTDDEGNMKTDNITTTVNEAFKDVQAAIINKQESINSAIARSNELIPQARGHAQKVLQEAEGYKEQVVAKADGESKRFISVQNEYKKAREVTKKRIYLETMQDILAGMDKVVLDTKGAGNVMSYLPLDELKKK